MVAITEKIGVLLVEDNHDDAFVVVELLGKATTEFTVTNVETVGQAVKSLADTHVHAILLDLNLPDAAGVDAYQHIMRIAPRLPIVVLTGQDDEETRLDLMRNGVQDIVFKKDLTSDVISRTITHAIERSKLKNQIISAEAQLRTVIVYNPDPMMVVDGNQVVRFCNRSAEEFIGLGVEALVGSEFTWPIEAGVTSEVEVRNNGIRSGEMRVNRIEWNRQPAHLVSIRDITQRKVHEEKLRILAADVHETNQQLERLTVIDSLTEVLNPRGLEAVLSRETGRARRTGASVSVMLVDCDQFAQVNERFGEVVGSVMLQEIASRIQDTVRVFDSVGRVGGDSFLCVLPDTRPAEAMQIAERLRQNIASHHFLFTSEPYSLTASIGVESLNSQPESLEQVMSRLRAAVVRAKGFGRDQVARARVEVATDPQDTSESVSELLDQVLNGGSADVVEQPIVQLTDGTVVAHALGCKTGSAYTSADEALVEYARQNKQLTALDLCHLQRCAQHAAQRALENVVHVGIYPSTLLAVGADRVLEILRGVGADLQWCVELNERQFLGTPVRFVEHVNALKNQGVSLALGDVGSGRGTLDSVILLEPEYVTVSAHAIDENSADAHRRKQLSRVVHLVTVLGAQLVAKGVTADVGLTHLERLGVSYGMGPRWQRRE